MNIREAILEEHSKAQVLRIADYIGDDKQRFKELMHLFLSDEYRVCQRSAWVVSTIADRNSELIEPYIEPMLLNLKEGVHPAVIRNTVRVLNNLKELPDNILGLAASICFNYLETPSVPVAIRVFSMRVLCKICFKEPDLKNELIILIEDMMPNESPGFKSAGKDVLKKLDTIK